MRFKDKVPVTSGAGREIGRACAARIASEGGSLNILDKVGAPANDAPDAIALCWGHATTVDISANQELSDAFSEIIRRHRRVDTRTSKSPSLRRYDPVSAVDVE